MDLRTATRRLVVLGAPLALTILELFHPAPRDFEEWLAQADWFFALHLIHLPLFGLLGLAVIMLLGKVRGPAAAVARGAIGVFVVVYSAYDTLAGIARGTLYRYARGVPPEEQRAIEAAAKALSNSNELIALFGIGTLGWTLGVVAATIALWKAGRPRLPLLALALGGLLLLGDHPAPFGPLAFGAFFLGAAGLEFAPLLTARRTAAATAA
jgi:hypothetical protein